MTEISVKGTVHKSVETERYVDAQKMFEDFLRIYGIHKVRFIKAEDKDGQPFIIIEKA